MWGAVPEFIVTILSIFATRVFANLAFVTSYLSPEVTLIHPNAQPLLPRWMAEMETSATQAHHICVRANKKSWLIVSLGCGGASSQIYVLGAVWRAVDFVWTKTVRFQVLSFPKASREHSM